MVDFDKLLAATRELCVSCNHKRARHALGDVLPNKPLVYTNCEMEGCSCKLFVKPAGRQE